jgi:hypothetical protein
MAHEWECPECGIWMSASDRRTLEWGIGVHVCEDKAPDDPPLVDPWSSRAFVGDGGDREPLEHAVVEWLARTYGRPFIWFRRGDRPLVVT